MPKQVIVVDDFRALVAALLERTFHPDPEKFDRIMGAKNIAELKMKVGANGTRLALIAVHTAIDWLGTNQPSAARIDCAHERIRR